MPPAAPAETLAPADEAILDGLQRAAFDYFVQHTNGANGLVADTSRPGAHASIAVVGFALSAYPVGCERGWMTRGEALKRSLAALRFLRDSDAWIDLRGIRDDVMRERRCDYFENSRRATYVQRAYAIRNPRGFVGYGEDAWGLSAGDGPRAPRQRIAGRRQSFYGYAARGVPYGPDDGTLAGPAVVASLPFAPELALPAIRRLLARGSAAGERAARAGGFNDTVHGGWVSAGTFGLDQGLIVLMIENFRTGLLWRLLRGAAPIRTGLHRAGFRGGWLAGDAPR